MGKEGPMIHSGAVVGAGLPQVRVDGLGRYIPHNRPLGRGTSVVELITNLSGAPNVALESDVSLG